MIDKINLFIQATALRAKAYYYLFDEFSKRFGQKETLEAAKKATYRLGEDKARSFPPEASESAEKLAQAFINDPIGSKVFDQSILKANEKMATIEMKACPLVQTWKEMGIQKDKIVFLCDFAHQIDYGNIETLGYSLSFPTRLACGESSCILKIKKKT